jgi:uncharacterized membrane protein
MEMSWQTPQKQETNEIHEIQKNSLMGKRSTMSSLIFLLLSLPMGIIFFTVTVTFLSLGVSTVIIWIGLPILLAAWHGFRRAAHGGGPAASADSASLTRIS